LADGAARAVRAAAGARAGACPCAARPRRYASDYVLGYAAGAVPTLINAEIGIAAGVDTHAPRDHRR